MNTCLLLLFLLPTHSIKLLVGNVELDSTVPTTLPQLLQQSNTFCASIDTNDIGIKPHRCPWVVAGSILDKLSSSTVQKFLAMPLNHPKKAPLNLKTLPLSTSVPSVLFLLHDASITKINGGLIGSIEAALALHAMGYHVRIALLHNSVDFITRHFPASAVLLLSYTDFSLDLIPKLQIELQNFEWSVVVATYFPTVWMALEISDLTQAKIAYFVQDYEPYFEQLPSPVAKAAALSYVVASERISIVSYSPWVLSKIQNIHNRKGTKVKCHPRRERKEKEELVSWPEEGDEGDGDVVVIVAMIRPSTPRRAPLSTLSTLRRVYDRVNKMNKKKNSKTKIQIVTFGCDAMAMNAFGKSTWQTRALSEWWRTKTSQTWPWLHHVGLLNHTQVSNLFEKADIFLDLSKWQAYGFAAQESMLHGVVPVVSSNSGVYDFVDSGLNAMIVEGEKQAMDVLERLVFNSTLRKGMGLEAMKKMKESTRDGTGKSWDWFLREVVGVES